MNTEVIIVIDTEYQREHKLNIEDALLILKRRNIPVWGNNIHQARILLGNEISGFELGYYLNEAERQRRLKNGWYIEDHKWKLNGKTTKEIMAEKYGLRNKQ